MAADWQVQRASKLICWPYPDLEPIRLALTAGDTESQNQEGNRRLALCGDRLISFIITINCFWSGVTRQSENETQVMIQSKKDCARRARKCRLDELVRASVRQARDGYQPVVLKNAMCALVAATWLQAEDWSQTLTTMMNLGLFCKVDEYVSPRQLQMTPWGPDEKLSQVVSLYKPHMEDGFDTLMSDDDQSGPTQPTASLTMANPALTIPSSATNSQWDGLNEDRTDVSDRTASEIVYTASLAEASVLEQGVAAESPNPSVLGDNNCRSASTSDRPPPVHGCERSGPLQHDAETDLHELAYQKAVSRVDPGNFRNLWQILQCVGSGSAIDSLRLLIINFRNVRRGELGKKNAVQIGARRTQQERLEAIEDLSLGIAHFSLARRMHIYMLYKEAESAQALESPGCQMEAAFVTETGLASPARPRGNPGHIYRAAISGKMASSGRSSSSSIKSLRRMGERLDILVKLFGLGVLAILDEELTQNMLLKVKNSAFQDFVRVVDAFEGNKIRDMSTNAKLIVDLLFDDSSHIGEQNEVFQIELGLLLPRLI